MPLHPGTNPWHGRVATARPKTDPTRGRRAAPDAPATAEDLVRAQDRQSLQTIMDSALRRREGLEADIARLRGGEAAQTGRVRGGNRTGIP